MDMTWREYTLRRLAYLKAKQDDLKTSWMQTREIAYSSLVATGAINPKKTPIEKFLNIEKPSKSNSRLTDDRLKALKKAQEKYQNEIKAKNGNRV